MTDPDRPPRRERTDWEAELLAAAADDDLDATEAEEYAALAAADPTVEPEVAELRALLQRLEDLGSGVGPVTTEPSPRLGERVLAIPSEHPSESPGTAEGDAQVVRLPRDRSERARVGGGVPPRRWLAGAAAAVVLLGAGAAGGALLDSRLSAPPDGPPGTLGAVEPIEFDGLPAGVEVDASLVAHTWGTETVLEMDGWTPGDRYRLVLVGPDGELEDSGTFLGSQVTIDCKMNGALLREDVEAVQILDDSDEVVATSDLPDVEA